MKATVLQYSMLSLHKIGSFHASPVFETYYFDIIKNEEAWRPLLKEAVSGSRVKSQLQGCREKRIPSTNILGGRLDSDVSDDKSS